MAKMKNRMLIVKTLIMLLIVGALAYGGWRIVQLRKTAAKLGGQLSSKSDEISRLKNDLITDPTNTINKIKNESTVGYIEDIGKLYTLPSNEQPSLTAVVQDDDKSKPPLDQPFFVDAKKGDYLVVYEKSGLAILYRPSEKKLVKVGSLNVQNTQSSQPTTQTSPAP